MPKKVVDDMPTLKSYRNERIIVSFPKDYTLSQCFEYLSIVTQNYPDYEIKDICLKWRLNAHTLWCATLVFAVPSNEEDDYEDEDS